LTVDPRYLDREGRPIDPAMSDYERKILDALRVVFKGPYSVFKVKKNRLNAGYGWEPDLYVVKDRKVIMIIQVMKEDTTLDNLDGRMRDVFAVVASNWEGSRHGGDFASRSRAVIVPDQVMEEMGQEGFLKYNYLFEPFGCEIISRKNIAELELHRDEHDRSKKPVNW